MSQETQLSLYNRAASSPIEPWAAAGNTALGPPQATPLRKIHRLLRGRYVLAFVLGIIGAAGGAVWGYLSQEPQHESSSWIEIAPIVPDPITADKVMAMYAAYMQSQVARIMDERVVSAAMDQPEWKALRNDKSPEAMQAFSKAMKVQHVKNTSIIQVTFA